MVSFKKMSVVAGSGGWKAISAHDDEFNVISESFRMGPAGKGFPLIQADQEEELRS